MKNLKKKDSSGSDKDSSGGGWEIVYSGFAMILLCFFIMLSSFSSIEETRVLRFVKSFTRAVSILPGGIKSEGGNIIVPPSADIVDSDSQLARIYEKLQTLAEHRKLEQDVAVDYSSKGLVMRLSDHALFDLGAADISPKAVPLLKKVGAIIAESPYEIRVEGHTDDLPIKTARYPSNWELSTARAVNVLRYFIETYGISSKRLSAEGYAEYQPMVPNNSVENRAKNRRVEIIFLNTESKDYPTEAAP
ncbi:MAG: OmpA family protein [Desulfobacterales bacterium]|nr:MAG: OmpA family protein [Desulfobacterales bacterium]